MFVGHEVLLGVEFRQARTRFAEFINSGWLTDESERAYADGLSGLTRVGPFGALLGASKLVRVQTLKPVPRDDAVVLPLRWEAVGVMGRLFPVFDADLVLTPAEAGTTRLALNGAYRPPLAMVGSALDRLALHQAAVATARSLVRRISASIGEPVVKPPTEAGASGTGPAPEIVTDPKHLGNVGFEPSM